MTKKQETREIVRGSPVVGDYWSARSDFTSVQKHSTRLLLRTLEHSYDRGLDSQSFEKRILEKTGVASGRIRPVAGEQPAEGIGGILDPQGRISPMLKAWRGVTHLKEGQAFRRECLEKANVSTVDLLKVLRRVARHGTCSRAHENSPPIGISASCVRVDVVRRNAVSRCVGTPIQHNSVYSGRLSTCQRFWTVERPRSGQASTYQAVKRSCRERGCLYEDPDFPPGPRALYKNKKPPMQPIVWMRPHSNSLDSLHRLKRRRPHALPVEFPSARECIIQIRKCHHWMSSFIKTNPVIKLKSQNIIPSHQFGFRSNQSTLQQCLRIVDLISSALEKKEYCGGVFLDVAQAFDRNMFRRLDAIFSLSNCG
ncbi:hypothetical protein AAG570_003972 [Ranatra chinensis]|uniref:Reverse transcriptase domain-containing protein n=1 Tax=Ranatra chinensis TaxID=642074 RepID=A0ABD0Y363_9HEMI